MPYIFIGWSWSRCEQSTVQKYQTCFSHHGNFDDSPHSQVPNSKIIYIYDHLLLVQSFHRCNYQSIYWCILSMIEDLAQVQKLVRNISFLPTGYIRLLDDIQYIFSGADVFFTHSSCENIFWNTENGWSFKHDSGFGWLHGQLESRWVDPC
jgi:hypothetical protein